MKQDQKGYRKAAERMEGFLSKINEGYTTRMGNATFTWRATEGPRAALLIARPWLRRVFDMERRVDSLCKTVAETVDLRQRDMWRLRVNTLADMYFNFDKGTRALVEAIASRHVSVWQLSRRQAEALTQRCACTHPTEEQIQCDFVGYNGKVAPRASSGPDMDKAREEVDHAWRELHKPPRRNVISQGLAERLNQASEVGLDELVLDDDVEDVI